MATLPIPYRLHFCDTTEHAPSSEATPLVTRPPTAPDMTSRPRSQWPFGAASRTTPSAPSTPGRPTSPYAVSQIVHCSNEMH
jgi:hypothetical protein